MMRIIIISLLLQGVFSFRAFSQVSEKEFDFLSKYYNDQYKKLIRARGIDTAVYFSSKYIEQNDPSKIATVIKKYFGQNNANIAALMSQASLPTGLAVH